MQLPNFAPETTGRIGSVTQTLVKSDGAGGWVEEEVPFNALYNALGQLTSFQAVGTSPPAAHWRIYNREPAWQGSMRMQSTQARFEVNFFKIFLAYASLILADYLVSKLIVRQVTLGEILAGAFAALAIWIPQRRIRNEE